MLSRKLDTVSQQTKAFLVSANSAQNPAVHGLQAQRQGMADSHECALFSLTIGGLNDDKGVGESVGSKSKNVDKL